MPAYPDDLRERDRFITSRRPPRPAHDPWHSQGVIVERELTEAGDVTDVATVFLTGRECPWRCVMCDLWRFTTPEPTPPGAIAAQTRDAVRRVQLSGRVTRIKLYNAGSFFDPLAVPPGDLDDVASATCTFERIIVESHPSLIGARTETFAAALLHHAQAQGRAAPTLEVAVGLETAHPAALERIHKRMTEADFRRAAGRLAAMGAALRVFLLISPPFIPAGEQDDWLIRSVDTAFEAGATVVTLIPTRAGNGAMDVLAASGDFRPPMLHDIERSLSMALARPRPSGARVFVDLWDLERFAPCSYCADTRRARLHAMNLDQQERQPVVCAYCTGRSLE